MAFSASEIAFEGFRLTREKPAAVGIWAVVNLALSLIGGVAVALVMGPELELVQNFQPDQPGDMEALNAMLPAMAKLNAITLPLSLISTALFTCAVLRAVLRPQDSRFGYLRFGADELRMMLLYLLFAVIYIAVMTVALVGVVLVASGLGMVLGAVGGSGTAAGLLAGLLTFCGLIAAAVWLAVRLSLAPAMTFAHGRLQLAEAWKLTRGRFWALLGAYFISWVLAVVVSLLGMAIVFGLAAAIGGGFGAMGAVMQPDLSTVAAQFTPTALVVSVCISVLAALQIAILKTPPALAYRELSEGAHIDTFA